MLGLEQCPEGTESQCDVGGAELRRRAGTGDLQAVLALGLREGVSKGGGPTGGMVREVPPCMPQVGAGGAAVADVLARRAGQDIT